MYPQVERRILTRGVLCSSTNASLVVRRRLSATAPSWKEVSLCAIPSLSFSLIEVRLIPVMDFFSFGFYKVVTAWGG